MVISMNELLSHANGSISQVSSEDKSGQDSSDFSVTLKLRERCESRKLHDNPKIARKRVRLASNLPALSIWGHACDPR